MVQGAANNGTSVASGRYVGQHGSDYFSFYFSEQTKLGRLVQVETFRPFCRANSCIVDFGCADGLFLRHLPARERIGVEVNPVARAECERVCAEQNIRIALHSSLETIEDNKADLLICNHVLEHVPEPFMTLQHIRRVLKPGGRLVLVVPFDDRRAAHHSNWQPNDIDCHLYTWSPRDIGNLLTAAGFSVKGVLLRTLIWHPRLAWMHRTFGRAVYKVACSCLSWALNRYENVCLAEVLDESEGHSADIADTCAAHEGSTVALSGQMTSALFWQDYHSNSRPSLPSRCSVFNRDFHRLIKRFVRPGMKVLEIGCAPGRQLVWLAKHFNAQVSGLDTDQGGIDAAKELFARMNLQADLRCEDIFHSHCPAQKYDVVYSTGLIEHFRDPTLIVRHHMTMLKPGGIAIITIPNYAGFYGRIERRFAPDLDQSHNLDIMSEQGMRRLVPEDIAHLVDLRPYGKFGAGWLISFQKRWSPWKTKILGGGMHLLGLAQPFTIKSLCPMWLLVMRRKDTTDSGSNENPSITKGGEACQ